MNNDLKDNFWNWLNLGFEKYGYTALYVSEDKNRIFYKLQNMDTLKESYILDITVSELYHTAPKFLKMFTAKKIIEAI